ncbi:ribonuclease P protein component [Emcibacter nanhaiensis]|uniref:Ribonuclease P protein component n=1 Tax=Emcibacter nanhaiensis TaxID=1505037 RepID=A0A501PBU3_9PROT|nr:ribonuclease P protein component [Emcibacter nanhaiensis]TPD57843.1 ribonuclease P protein component [Emcibacter nanhaiensis]
MTQQSETKDKKITVLQKRSDFLRVARANKKWISPAMIVQTCKQPEGVDSGEEIRVGYTTSKKVGNAVVRNRARRRLREVVRRVLPEKGKAGQDYVLIARSGIEERSFDDLIRDLKWSLKRLGDENGKKPAQRRNGQKREQVAASGGEK